jgi:hypothetical protein
LVIKFNQKLIKELKNYFYKLNNIFQSFMLITLLLKILTEFYELFIILIIFQVIYFYQEKYLY